MVKNKKQKESESAVFFVLIFREHHFPTEFAAATWGKGCEIAVANLFSRIETFGQVVKGGQRFVVAATNKDTYERVFKVKIHLCSSGWVQNGQAQVPSVLIDWITGIALGMPGQQ